MSRIRRHREKNVTGNELSRDDSEEGTAARTRPLSHEEIMLRRERKKLAVDAENGAGEPEKLGKSNVESLVDHSESDRGYKQSKNIDDVVRKHNSEDRQAPRKKEDASMKEDNVARSKRKEKREIKADIKVKSDRGPTSRAKSDSSGIRSHRRNKNADQPKDDFEDESERKLPKVGVVKEKNVDRDKGKSERETKRKHGNIDHEKSISDIKRSDGKKRDSGKWHNSESSERRGWKDSSQSHYDEARPKRRRSRSRELVVDGDRRSPSVSPRAHKHSSYHGQDRGEGSSHSFKDRPARHDYDVDKYRTSSNGGYSSSHYRRHGGYSSGIGGYSPRKRKTVAAVKTPSPTSRSPERKNVGWDRVPAGMDIISSASLLTNFQPSPQAILSNSQKLPSASPVALIMAKPLSGAAQNSVSMVNNMPVDSFELTQATLPMRRLCLENIPDSSSDKDLMECLNDYLLSRGVSHYQGVKPCISCMVNKEKRQAVVEFLTPEDATLALSFDGRSFSGSILQIRRPKDFVEPEPATAAAEKPEALADAISGTVSDSAHKIFVGGISRALSSDMFMEIASAFGHLKAYHFQFDKDLNEAVAFLEYADHSVTLEACAGLNGMKLGGQVLTAVQAFPCAPKEENDENTEKPPFYGIPEHGKAVLEKPTKVLKLKNVFKPEDLSSLSGLELEEILEDIRLECARFGTVKSVNIVRGSGASKEAEVTVEADDTKVASQCPVRDDDVYNTEFVEGDFAVSSGVNSTVNPQNNDQELREDVENTENNCTSEDKPVTDTIKEESSEPVQPNGNMGIVDLTSQLSIDVDPQEALDQLDTVNNQSEYDDKNASTQADESGPGNNLMVEELRPGGHTDDKLQESATVLNDAVAMECGTVEKSDGQQKASDFSDVFEEGCVLVEYLRTEASCMAAHCLHGRLYGDQVVAVGYISHDLYLMRFLN